MTGIPRFVILISADTEWKLLRKLFPDVRITKTPMLGALEISNT